MASPGAGKKRARRQGIEDAYFRCIKVRLGAKVPYFKSKERLCVQKDAVLRAYMADTRDVKAQLHEPREVKVSINLEHVMEANLLGLNDKGNACVVRLVTSKDVRSGNKHLLGKVFFFYFHTETLAQEFVDALECHGVVPVQASQSQSSDTVTPPVAQFPRNVIVEETPSPPQRLKRQSVALTANDDPVVSKEVRLFKHTPYRQTRSPSQSMSVGTSHDGVLTRLSTSELPQAGQLRKPAYRAQNSNELTYNDIKRMDGEQLLLAFDGDPVIESLRMCLGKICDSVVENYIRIHVETKRKDKEHTVELMKSMVESLRIHGGDIARLQKEVTERANDIQTNAKACDQGYSALLEPMQMLIKKFMGMVTEVEARHTARQVLAQPFPK